MSAKKGSDSTGGKGDAYEKLALKNRKIAPRLRLFANCDEDVCLARAEHDAALAVTDVKKLEHVQLFRTPVAVQESAAREKGERPPLHKPVNSAKASVFVHFAEGEGEKLSDSSVQRRRGSVGTAEVALGQLAKFVDLNDVTYVEAGESVRVPPLSVTNHPSETEAPGKLDRKITALAKKHKYGEDVLVGIIDVSGIAFAHEDFLDGKGETRIARIWDMGGDLRDPPKKYKFDYGSEFHRDHLNAAIKTAKKIGVSPYSIETQSQQAQGSHGTHVASIAAGNLGVCRKADIACVMLDLREEDFDRRRSFYDSVRIAHAVEYLQCVAEELGKERGKNGPLPLSINISLGTNGHAHDGSSAISRWIDNFLSMSGRSVAVAAGNSGQEAADYPGDIGFVMGRIHSSGNIGARGLTKTLDWIVVGDGVSDISENEMEIWYEPQDRFTVMVTPPGTDSEPIGPVGPGEYIENRQLPDGTFISIYNELYSPSNGANYISIYLTPRLKGNLIGVQSGEWRVTLKGDDVRDGNYHVWIERDDPRPHKRRDGVSYMAYPSFFSKRSNVDRNSVSSLACGDRILSIGNFDEGRRRANISSSQGPTRDNRNKPELLAPGTDIVAANGFAGVKDPWTGMTGTSMASPFAAGVAGLMLNVEPSLTAAQIIGIMRRTASPLDDGDYSWRDDVGFGVIKPEACLEQADVINSRKDLT